jgi:hypothetical protein
MRRIDVATAALADHHQELAPYYSDSDPVTPQTLSTALVITGHPGAAVVMSAMSGHGFS